MTLIETTVGALAGNDIGARAVIIFDGQTIDGEIEKISWINYKASRGVECYELHICTGESSTSILRAIPLDYRLQIERPLIGIDLAKDGAQVVVMRPDGKVEYASKPEEASPSDDALVTAIYDFMWQNGTHHRSMFDVDQAAELAARYIRERVRTSPMTDPSTGGAS